MFTSSWRDGAQAELCLCFRSQRVFCGLREISMATAVMKRSLSETTTLGSAGKTH